MHRLSLRQKGVISGLLNSDLTISHFAYGWEPDKIQNSYFDSAQVI